MLTRTALAVTGATGGDDLLARELASAGYAPAETVATLEEVLPRLRQGQYDLLIVPLDQHEAPALADLERALRRDPAMSVIGTGPSADSELILRGLRAGTHEFLVRPATSATLSAALDRMRRRVLPDAKRGFVTAVYSPKGGLGATTVAINLAFALAKQAPGQRVALVDLVVDDAEVSMLLNMSALYDLGDLAARGDDVDESVLLSIMSKRPGGVWVLPAAERRELAPELDAATTSSIIAQLRAYFDFVVLDCPDNLHESTLTALHEADRILLLTQQRIQALRSTQQTLEVFRRRGYAEDKTWVVANRTSANEPLSLADARAALEHDINFSLPNDTHACTLAVTKGAPVLDCAADSKLAQHFLQLAAKLGGAAGMPAKPAPRSTTSTFGRLLHLGG